MQAQALCATGSCRRSRSSAGRDPAEVRDRGGWEHDPCRCSGGSVCARVHQAGNHREYTAVTSAHGQVRKVHGGAQRRRRRLVAHQRPSSERDAASSQAKTGGRGGFSNSARLGASEAAKSPKPESPPKRSLIVSAKVLFPFLASLQIDESVVPPPGVRVTPGSFFQKSSNLLTRTYELTKPRWQGATDARMHASKRARTEHTRQGATSPQRTSPLAHGPEATAHKAQSETAKICTTCSRGHRDVELSPP